jgi:patatin-like phospholipase/acyl hydrolase
MKLRILTIDGGGAKGIVPAVILEYIEARIIEITGNPRVHLSDFLDFVAGTAAGSLTSTMLITPNRHGKPAYSTTEIIEKLFEFSTVYYQKKDWRSLWGNRGPKYPYEAVNDKHVEVFDHWRMKDLLLPTAIPTYDILNRKPIIFGNDKNSKYNELFVKDIVMGGSASPAWIKPTEFRDGIYKNIVVNGNSIANNPSSIAYIEAIKNPTLIEKYKKLTPENILLISLGSGISKFQSHTMDNVKRWNRGNWFELVTSMTIQSSTRIEEYKMETLFNTYNCGNNYIRIDPFINLGSSNIMDTSDHNMKDLLQDAKNYINDNKELLNSIALRLLQENIIYRELI